MSNSLLGESKLLDICPYIVSFPRNEEIHRAMLKKRYEPVYTRISSRLMEAGEIFSFKYSFCAWDRLDKVLTTTLRQNFYCVGFCVGSFEKTNLSLVQRQHRLTS